MKKVFRVSVEMVKMMEDYESLDPPYATILINGEDAFVIGDRGAVEFLQKAGEEVRSYYKTMKEQDQLLRRIYRDVMGGDEDEVVKA